MTIDLKKFIAEVPDFPKKGVGFKDLTPMMGSAEAFRESVSRLAQLYSKDEIDAVLSAEARGYIWGGALAKELNAGIIPARKPGKLPRKAKVARYQLEYGTDELHIHEDAIKKGQVILIFDDVLATGGTAAALASLVEECGGNVGGLAFVVELSFLNGRAKLGSRRVDALVKY